MFNVQLSAAQIDDLYIRLNMAKLYKELDAELDAQSDDDDRCLVTEHVQKLPMQDKISAIQAYEVIRFY